MASRIFFPLLLFAVTFSASPAQQLNLAMERVDAEGKPLQWKKGSSPGQAIYYTIEADSVIRHNGKYSLKITGKDAKNIFGSVMLQIPCPVTSGQVVLKGFLRTENVNKGFAGLFLTLSNERVTFENDYMQERGVTGTHNWQAFSISLPCKKGVTQINFGALLNGEGIVWVDDLSLYANNAPIQSATIIK